MVIIGCRSFSAQNLTVTRSVKPPQEDCRHYEKTRTDDSTTLDYCYHATIVTMLTSLAGMTINCTDSGHVRTMARET